jgi:hypothetical protein
LWREETNRQDTEVKCVCPHLPVEHGVSRNILTGVREPRKLRVWWGREAANQMPGTR